MKKFDCYKAEPDTTPNGNALKKLVLQEEGKQYPIKNVTIWANHPLFEDMVAGWSGELEIEEKDSGVANPKAPGKNYINRTVIDPSYTPKSAPKNTDTPHEDISIVKLYNLVNLKVLPEIQALKDRLDVFIDEENIQPKFNKKPKDDIAEEDSPF